MMKKLLGRLALLALLGAALQLGLARLAPRDHEDYERFVASAPGVDIVQFGDSTDAHCDPADTDRRAIHESVHEALRPRVLLPATRPAYHLAVYEAYAHAIARLPARPRCVVVPINLRSFSPTWCRRPQYQYAELRYSFEWTPFVYDALIHPLMVGKVVSLSPVSEREFLETPVFDGADRIGSVATLERCFQASSLTNEQKKHVVAYMYGQELTDEHPFLHALASLVTTLRAAGVAPIVYVTPIDHETAARWGGPDLQDRVSHNVSVIQRVLASRGSRAVDLSFALGSGAFSYRVVPNEHLKSGGRSFVASAIAAEARPLLR